MPAAKMTVEQAAAFIAEHAGLDAHANQARLTLLTDGEARASLFRKAAATLHPDRGGDPDLFRRLVEARDLLDAQ